MLKHAVHACLIAALVAGGIFVGYRQGLSTARPAAAVPAPAVTAKIPRWVSLPGFKISDRTFGNEAIAPAFEALVDDFALMQRPVERSIKLDSAPLVGLFGPPVLSGDPNPQPVRIDYGIPIARDGITIAGGKFNFNIGYQF
ncbi:MAG TPA: hypothetical protein VGO11_17870 [Chthoniobacteraceae bacterium]|jgi:hypothetical protein|nr:hypothetical protein [Chthoniobacteraceae bacterium]